MQIGRPLLRATRATVFAAVCVLLSAALHSLVSGRPVRPDVLLGACALTWAGAYLLSGRQRGMDVLLAACFATQYGMHLLFDAGATTPVRAAEEHGTGLGMLLVHVMTALMTAWWLERGESALAIVLHLAVTTIGRWWHVLVVLAGGPADEGPRGRLPSHDEPATFPSRRFAAALPRRGPPAPSAAF